MTTTAYIHVHYDYDSTPDEAECYTPKQVAAFERDEWNYVGIIPHVEYSDAYSTTTIEGPSLWGIDYGCPATDEDDNLLPDRGSLDAYLRECAAEQWQEVPDALRAAVGPIDWSTARLVWS